MVRTDGRNLPAGIPFAIPVGKERGKSENIKI